MVGVFQKDFSKVCEKIKNIRMLVFDVDGVLTNGDLVYGHGNSEFKQFSAQDGMGFSLARKAGMKMALITARNSEIVERRAKELKLDAWFQGNKDKGLALDQILLDFDLAPEHICFMGDDLLDLVLLRRVGFAAAPANARPEVMDVVDYVTEASGGHGAARELIEVVLKVQEKWDQLLSLY